MRYVFRFLVALAVLAFAACGDGGGDGECGEPLDVAGEWRMTATPIEDTCGGDLTPYMFGVTIMQEGNDLVGQAYGATFPGTICGDQIQMSGSFTDYGAFLSFIRNLINGQYADVLNNVFGNHIQNIVTILIRQYHIDLITW